MVRCTCPGRKFPEVPTPFDGGRLVQALGGAKVGVRRDGYGVFAKIRAGVNHYSRAFASGDTITGAIQTRGSNVAAIDVGGVVERYVGRRWLIRFDGSDVISIFHPATFVINGRIIARPVPTPTDSIQLVVGAGWRFWRLLNAARRVLGDSRWRAGAAEPRTERDVKFALCTPASAPIVGSKRSSSHLSVTWRQRRTRTSSVTTR